MEKGKEWRKGSGRQENGMGSSMVGEELKGERKAGEEADTMNIKIRFR